MDNAVIIKSSKYGITLILDEAVSFDELKNLIKNKFEQSAKFFGEADMVLAFEGKKLDVSQQQEVLEIIGSVTSINVTCIVDENEAMDAKFSSLLDKKKESTNTEAELFYKGTLRSGQILETESSVIILGDINPGGKVVSKGSVVVLGSLRGTVYAGASGNENSFVVALEMNPMQIKIADTIARSSDSTTVKAMKKNKDIQPKIAYIYEANIYVEDLTQEILEDIKLD